MKITVLGCGGAGGVPLIGGDWGSCDPNNPKNRRLRCSLKIEEDDVTLLIDTSPDMREQLLRAGLKDLTAILYTHEHADHTHGIDGIRSINWLTGHAIPVYASAATMENLRKRFDYIFDPPPGADRFLRPVVNAHVIEGPLSFGPLRVTSFRQAHGTSETLGFRINDFAYSTDVSALDEDAFAVLQGVDVWIVGAIREKPHTQHAHLERVLEWIARVKPRKAYLTHMNNTMDYDTLMRRLPDGVEPAYDGLVFTHQAF